MKLRNIIFLCLSASLLVACFGPKSQDDSLPLEQRLPNELKALRQLFKEHQDQSGKELARLWTGEWSNWQVSSEHKDAKQVEFVLLSNDSKQGLFKTIELQTHPKTHSVFSMEAILSADVDSLLRATVKEELGMEGRPAGNGYVWSETLYDYVAVGKKDDGTPFLRFIHVPQ